MKVHRDAPYAYKSSWIQWSGMKRRQEPVEAIYGPSIKKDCLKFALVLDAAGIHYEIQKKAGEFILLVAAPDAGRARAELDAYALENRDWPTGDTVLAQRSSGWGGVLGYVAVLLLVAIVERLDVLAFDWFAAGKTHAGLIRHGQWWRTVTALTLHADARHLFANIATGGLIGLFAGQLLGSGLAWMSILIAGAAGNLLNAWIRQPGHTSVGASTAVFAGLGIVAAYVWKRRRHVQAPRLKRWAPLVGAVVLLSYLGTGGVRTDVGAHVTGFLSGVVLGALYGHLGNRVALAAGAQFLLGIGALAILGLAWALALG